MTEERERDRERKRWREGEIEKGKTKLMEMKMKGERVSHVCDTGSVCAELHNFIYCSRV